LPQHYFDIKTVPLDEYRNDAGASFDPSKAKIISYGVRGLKLRWERRRSDLGVAYLEIRQL